MQKSAQIGGFSYQNEQQPDGGFKAEPNSSKLQWTTSLDCDRCDHDGPFIATNPRVWRTTLEVMCPKCKKIKNVRAVIDPKNGKYIRINDKIKVKDEPVDAPIFEKKRVKKSAQKRNLDGIPEKDTFKGPRIMRMHEDVNPQGVKSIGPFTKERENYKNEHKVIQSAGLKDVKTQNKLTENEKEILSNSSKIMTDAAKQELAKSAAMYPQVSVMPASQHGLCQWCPKLRATVAMDVCATKCIDARRIPQAKGFETFRDYLLGGGDPNGIVVCGYKEWLKREVDAFYPGWVEDHIRRAGGEVVGSETNYGNRRMNLDENERRHRPRYPEEFATERRLEERHNYVPEFKTASAKMAQNTEDKNKDKQDRCNKRCDICKEVVEFCKCKNK